jgi:hypothetical protein
MSAPGLTKAGQTRSGGAAITRDALSVRGMSDSSHRTWRASSLLLARPALARVWPCTALPDQSAMPASWHGRRTGQTLPAAALTGDRPADWPLALCSGGYEHDPARMTITGRQPPTRSTWHGQPQRCPQPTARTVRRNQCLTSLSALRTAQRRDLCGSGCIACSPGSSPADTT